MSPIRAQRVPFAVAANGVRMRTSSVLVMKVQPVYGWRWPRQIKRPTCQWWRKNAWSSEENASSRDL
jgi:hypothetical protein